MELVLMALRAADNITLYPGASDAAIKSFEDVLQLTLPDDFKTFYKYCNGFCGEEDMFNMITLDEMLERYAGDSYLMASKDFYFAEYMIYCDMWAVSIDPDDHNTYIIYQKNKGDITIYTNSLAKFLMRYLNGGVYEGLYPWEAELQRRKGDIF